MITKQPLEPDKPRTFDGPLEAAFDEAMTQREPLFVPATIYTDDRGWSIMNQFQKVLKPTGQINYSVLYPYVIKAWHRHARQTDFWMCLSSHIKVGIHRDQDNRSWMAVIGERRPGIMIIPPPLWHGAASIGPEPAGLLYYVTHPYDSTNPDEDRRSHDSVPGFPWQVQHR